MNRTVLRHDLACVIALYHSLLVNPRGLDESCHILFVFVLLPYRRKL